MKDKGWLMKILLLLLMISQTCSASLDIYREVECLREETIYDFYSIVLGEKNPEKYHRYLGEIHAYNNVLEIIESNQLEQRSGVHILHKY